MGLACMLLAALARRHQGRRAGRGEPQGGEAADPQVPAEALDPGDAVLGDRVRATGEPAGHLGEARHRRVPGFPRAQGAEVHGEARTEEGRTQRAVRSAEGRPGRRREPVDGPQPGVGEAQAAEEARQRQVLPPGGVEALQAGGAQRAGRSPHPLGRQRIRDRVGPDREVRLDELGESVETAGREHRARRAGDEVRVHHGQPGEEVQAPEARLGTSCGEDRVPGHLRARAGGGGDGHERQRRAGQGTATADHLEVLERVLGPVAGEPGDRLAEVDGAAAADRDDALAALRARQRRRRPDVLHGGLARDPLRHRAHAPGPERLRERGRPREDRAR